jgi:hypothetical protein
MRCSCGDANRVGQNRDGDRGERRKTPCSGCVASFLSPALDTCLAPTTEYSSIGIPAPEEAPVPPGSAGVSPAWGWFARQLAIGMVPPRPLGSALEDERISRSGIGRALPWERGRPRPHPGDRGCQWLGFAWLPVALWAPRSGTSASPGLGLAGHPPGSAGVSPASGDRAGQRLGYVTVPRRPAGSALGDERTSTRGIGGARPGSAGVPARIRERTVCWLEYVAVPRRPAGSALEDERIPKRGIGGALSGSALSVGWSMPQLPVARATGEAAGLRRVMRGHDSNRKQCRARVAFPMPGE